MKMIDAQIPHNKLQLQILDNMRMGRAGKEYL
jgi:hypothetical protein